MDAAQAGERRYVGVQKRGDEKEKWHSLTGLLQWTQPAVLIAIFPSERVEQALA